MRTATIAHASFHEKFCFRDLNRYLHGIYSDCMIYYLDVLIITVYVTVFTD